MLPIKLRLWLVVAVMLAGACLSATAELRPLDGSTRKISPMTTPSLVEAKIPSGIALLLDLAISPERSVLVFAHRGPLQPDHAISLRTVASLVHSNTADVQSLRYDATVDVSLAAHASLRERLVELLGGLSQTHMLSLNKLVGKASTLQRLDDQTGMWLLYPGATEERFAMWSMLRTAPINATHSTCACSLPSAVPGSPRDTHMPEEHRSCGCDGAGAQLGDDASSPSQAWAATAAAGAEMGALLASTVPESAFSLPLLRRLAVIAPPPAMSAPPSWPHSPVAPGRDAGAPQSVASRLVAAALSAEGRVSELGAPRAQRSPRRLVASAADGTRAAPLLWRHSSTHGSSLVHRAPLEHVAAATLLRLLRGTAAGQAGSRGPGQPGGERAAQGEASDRLRLLHGLGGSAGRAPRSGRAPGDAIRSSEEAQGTATEGAETHWLVLCASRERADAADAWAAMRLAASATVLSRPHGLRLAWVDSEPASRPLRGRTGILSDAGRHPDVEDTAPAGWVDWARSFLGGAPARSATERASAPGPGGSGEVEPGGVGGGARTSSSGAPPLRAAAPMAEDRALALLGCGTSADKPVVRYFGPAERRVVAPLDYAGAASAAAAVGRLLPSPSPGDRNATAAKLAALSDRVAAVAASGMRLSPAGRVSRGLRPVEPSGADLLVLAESLTRQAPHSPASGGRGVTLLAVSASLEKAIAAVQERIASARSAAGMQMHVQGPRLKGTGQGPDDPESGRRDDGSGLSASEVALDAGQSAALRPRSAHDDHVAGQNTQDWPSDDWSDFRVAHSDLRPEPPAAAVRALVTELWEAAVALGGAGVSSESAVAGRLGLLDGLAAGFAMLPSQQMRARIAVVQGVLQGTGVPGARANLENQLLADWEVGLEAKARAAEALAHQQRRRIEARHSRLQQPEDDNSEQQTGEEGDQGDGNNHAGDLRARLAARTAGDALTITQEALRGSLGRASTHSRLQLHGPRERRLAEQYVEYMDAAFRSGKATEWLEQELRRVTKRLATVASHRGDEHLSLSARRGLGTGPHWRRTWGGAQHTQPHVPPHAQPPPQGGPDQSILLMELQQRRNILESLTSQDRRDQLVDWAQLEQRRSATFAANGLVPFSDADRKHAEAVRKYGDQAVHGNHNRGSTPALGRDEL